MTMKIELLNVTGKAPFRSVAVIACIYGGAALAQAEVPHARNLVIEPDYTTASESDANEVLGDAKPAPQKLQFEPIIDDKPILEERKLKEEIRPGVEYPEGVEMVVTPEPGFAIKEEAIEEANEEVIDEKADTLTDQ